MPPARSPVTIASEWPEPYRRMCSSASSRLATTFTAATSDRNSLPQSSADAGTEARRPPAARGPPRRSARISTRAFANSAAIFGSQDGAMSRCTSTVSSALQMVGRRTLALYTMPQRHLRIGGAIDIRVAHAGAGLDDRHRRVLDGRLDQALATARDDHVDVLAQLQHPLHERAIGRRDQLHRRLGQPDVLQALLNRRHDRAVARQRFTAPAQHHRIARLQANRRDVARHVGPRLVHDADHAQAARAASRSPGRWGASIRSNCSPNGSASPATASTSRAIAATRCGVRRRRSISMRGDALAQSCALAARISASRARMARAIAASARFLRSVDACASTIDAAFAPDALSISSSVVTGAVNRCSKSG